MPDSFQPEYQQRCHPYLPRLFYCRSRLGRCDKAPTNVLLRAYLYHRDCMELHFRRGVNYIVKLRRPKVVLKHKKMEMLRIQEFRRLDYMYKYSNHRHCLGGERFSLQFQQHHNSRYTSRHWSFGQLATTLNAQPLEANAAFKTAI